MSRKPKNQRTYVTCSVNRRYADLRRRVKKEWGFPSMSAADAYIVRIFEGKTGSNQKADENLKKAQDFVKDALYGGGLI